MKNENTAKPGIVTDQLRAEVQEYLKTEGASQRRIAIALGKSTSLVNSWLHGNYHGTPQTLAGVNQLIRTFLDRQKERAAMSNTSLEFVPTTASKKIFEIAKLCLLDGEIGVVVSDAGMGKTMAAKEFARIDSSVLLIEVNPGDSASMLFDTLHRMLGYDGNGRIIPMFRDVCDKLRGSRRLLIVDEAESLAHRALELLRRLHDHTGIGLLLLGMPRLYSNLRGMRGEYAQLFSRVGIYARLDAASLKDVECVLGAVMPDLNGVAKVFYELSGGRMRTLAKLARRSMRVAEIHSVPITADLVREAAESLIF